MPVKSRWLEKYGGTSEMAKAITFIWVGKLKKSFWQEAAEHYWRRLGRFYKLHQTILKNAPASLGPELGRKDESQRILKRIGCRERAIVLDIKGSACSSHELAQRLQSWSLDGEKSPCFILGGSYGVEAWLCSRADFVLSLGPMTLPHELARVVLLEQLYRAACIGMNHPYHH